MMGGAEPPKQSAQALSHRNVRGAPGEGRHPEGGLLEGARHTFQRLDSASSMGLPGWHWTSPPKGAQNTYLADTREEALKALAKRHAQKG